MTPIWQFALYNLAASLAAGFIAYIAVMGALHLLKAPNAFLYASFLALPLFKSILILLGIGLILPWSGLVDFSRQALPAGDVLPYLFVWFAAVWALYQWLARRARADLLQQATSPIGLEGERLEAALNRVVSAYEKGPCCQAGETVCCISDKIPSQPHILLTEQLRTPVALIEGGQPVILFPHGLVSCLEDAELDLALAHELNHFALRKPGWWTSSNLRLLALISPVTVLLADAIQREEEKACDDLAVRMLGGPEVYAGMLMKSYQFAKQVHQPDWKIILLPRLLSAKPFLSKRVERLLQPRPAASPWFTTLLFTWAVWGLLLYLLFFAQFGA